MSRVRARSRMGGYTLMEMMMVVAILSILMTLLIYGIFSYRRKAMEEGARALVTQVRAALDQYKSEYGAYPPDGYDFAVMRSGGGGSGQIKGSQCLIYFLGFPSAAEVKVGQETRWVDHAPFLALTTGMLSGSQDTELDVKLADVTTELIDPFGNALHYDNCWIDDQGNVKAAVQSDRHLENGVMVVAPDPRQTGGGAKAGAMTGTIARNKGGYDLWSHGQKIADPTDDLTNWR